MRKSGSTRGSPNLVILRLRKIKFLQKGTFGKTLGVPVWYRPKGLRCLRVSLYRPGEACIMFIFSMWDCGSWSRA
ncbi:hypothetical protein L3X38_024485 [Prunus dulcis]|uniref:Uncharacterized protein n=1 Tax=Prunus dulcis TaxID=3755 RepID=A0AAD4W2L7_PRUDU|nr:hypothetical protein L3X38_024485 [Prunus dulcis]